MKINDIGFLERSDYRAPHYQIEYLNVDSELFRFYWLWADVVMHGTLTAI